MVEYSRVTVHEINPIEVGQIIPHVFGEGILGVKWPTNLTSQDNFEEHKQCKQFHGFPLNRLNVTEFLGNITQSIIA
jgi:hypothetical protein